MSAQKKKRVLSELIIIRKWQGGGRIQKDTPNGTWVLSLGTKTKSEFISSLIKRSFLKVFWVWYCLLNSNITHRCLDLLYNNVTLRCVDLLLLLLICSLPTPEIKE